MQEGETPNNAQTRNYLVMKICQVVLYSKQGHYLSSFCVFREGHNQELYESINSEVPLWKKRTKFNTRKNQQGIVLYYSSLNYWQIWMGMERSKKTDFQKRPPCTNEIVRNINWSPRK